MGWITGWHIVAEYIDIHGRHYIVYKEGETTYVQETTILDKRVESRAYERNQINTLSQGSKSTGTSSKG